MRSGWEKNVYRYLRWLVGQGQIKSFEYEADTFEFPVKRGNRFYTPDFKVFENDGSFSYHEIKGWMDPGSATKLKRMAKYYPNVKIVVIGKEEYAAIAKFAKALVPGWE